MLQRGPADPPRRSERNGVSIELPNQDVGLLSASRDIEIAVSGQRRAPQNKNSTLRSSSVRRPYSCQGVLRLRAIQLSKLQCNRIPNGKMVHFVDGDFFGQVRCATVRNAYNFSHALNQHISHADLCRRDAPKRWHPSAASASSQREIASIDRPANRGPPNRRDGQARRLLFELSTGRERLQDPLRLVCCTEKKIPAAVERSCWFALGTCRELALV
jgi:hypothetical protein